jgi:hypothetical protein
LRRAFMTFLQMKLKDGTSDCRIALGQIRERGALSLLTGRPPQPLQVAGACQKSFGVDGPDGGCFPKGSMLKR